jgi:site-specific recombinase XerD
MHITGERNLSPNTAMSYRDTFKLFLVFLRDERNLPPEKLTLNDINRCSILDFIDWLKSARKSSASTCSQRLGAIHAFFEYVKFEMPEKIQICQEVLSTKAAKAPQAVISYLSLDGVKAILTMPDISIKSGRRDVTILSLLYDTGARVQELADITIGDVRFVTPATVRLVGKGNKARIVPLLRGTESLLKEYLKDMAALPFADNSRPLFQNREGQKFSRWGINYIFAKYCNEARTKNPVLIPDKLSPHCFRHSKAMHLLQADVNLIYIRDLLGHTNIKTTETYARADSAAKREALERANPIKEAVQFPSWNIDAGLMEWLQNYGKSHKS